MRARAVALLCAPVLGAVVLAAAGCASDKKPSGTGDLEVTATDTQCTVAKTSLPAGRHTFAVTNKGTKVTEFYVYAAGDRVVGEVENVTPGLRRTLVVDLPAGSYQAACKPGMTGDGIRTTLTVTGAAPSQADNAKLAAAVQGYQQYVKSQVATLVDRTGAFVAAVKAGDTAQAKTLYPQARTYYERIEPVAESFGDLDPKIDAREDNVEQGTPWTGFHRLEKDLWSGVKPNAAVADQLNADVAALKTKVDGLTLTPLELANGAKELLDEVAASKVTGEEDRYSHTDLWDFQANVEGSKAAVAALRPFLDEKNPALGPKLDEKFAAVQKELNQYRSGDGFVTYTDLKPPQVKALSDALNGLAEPVSQVAGLVAK
jgi:iron uptake system component EfeO